MSRVETTKINKDGLRYKSKEGGTPFGGSSHIGTMSCYKCGFGCVFDLFGIELPSREITESKDPFSEP